MKAAAIFEVDENVDLSRCIFGGDWKLYFIHKGERRASVVGHLIRGLRPLPEKKTYSEAEFWCNSMQSNISEIEGWNKCLKAITGEPE